jgi:peptidoglycan hydrolase-like protein with peptidoglycan-binding domain
MTNRYLITGVLSLSLCLLAPLSHGASSATDTAPTSFKQLVMDIQHMLTELGYRPGPVDGSYGTSTRQAIKRYQSNTGLVVDGHPSEGATSGTARSSAPAKAPRKAAWQGSTIADSLLRIAPSGASTSKQRLPKGTQLEVIRRQGAWLEVRVKASGSEGWVKQSSVRGAETAAAPSKKKKSGGFFANLSRGISRLLGGSREEPRDQGNVTVGIRGLAPEDLAATIPDPAELDKMEGFRADRDQAYRFAGEEQLTAQSVEYIEPAGTAGSAPASSGGRED